MNWWANFVAANRNVSARLGMLLPHTRTNLQDDYRSVVAEYVNSRGGSLIVDVGAGKRCQYADLVHPNGTRRLVGIDVSLEEMSQNEALDDKIVADVTEHIPLEDNVADMLVSRSTLEHLRHVQPFLEEAFRCLKPEGYTIHVFPSRWSPFSLLNRCLPNRVSKLLLAALVPGSGGVLGFPAYYDHCSAGEMERLMRGCGFEIVETRVGYHQASYFGFFVPLYLANLLYETVFHRLGNRQLAANVLIVARKPSG